MGLGSSQECAPWDGSSNPEPGNEGETEFGAILRPAMRPAWARPPGRRRGDPDAMIETRLRDLAAREREHARPFVDLPAGDGVVEDAEGESERLGIDPAG